MRDELIKNVTETRALYAELWSAKHSKKGGFCRTVGTYDKARVEEKARVQIEAAFVLLQEQVR